MIKAHNLKVNILNWLKYEEKENWSLRKNDREFDVGDVCLLDLRTLVVEE